MTTTEVQTPVQKTEKRTRPPKKVNKFDFERNSRTIFVGNLPSKLDQKDVAKMFKDCGPVESARIRSVVPEKEKLPPKVAQITKRIHPKVDSVNGYLVFKTNANDQCVKKALAMNGRLIDGHHIRVDRAQRPKAKRETLTSRKKSVFVGNLRFDIRDDDLRNHFEKVGAVNYVRLVRDSSSGLGKGFGFVVFNERASVKKALELNDSDFRGRKIRVKKIEEEDKKKARKNSKNEKSEEIDEQPQDEDDDDDDDDGDGNEVEMDEDDDEVVDEDDDIEPSDDQDASEQEAKKPVKPKKDPKKKKFVKSPKTTNGPKLGVKLANKKKNRSNFAKKVKATKGKGKFGKRGKK